MSRVQVQAFRPTRPWVEPGGQVGLEAVLWAEAPVEARVEAALLDLEREVATSATGPLWVGPDETVIALTLGLPQLPRHGYGLRLVVTAADGTTVVARAAVEALQGWWQSPRHAALTDYRSPAAAAEATRALADWHVTVVQHYDWMWRHYRYRPPDGASHFVDALGRTVSHDAVRASVAEGHRGGLASLAYGSVYGAEAEHVERHPDERVFDADGAPLSLGDTFFINDVRPGSSWRARLLAEYEWAVQDFGFDGVHMDTYGPPHAGVGADGGPIEFAALYPGLISEAAARLEARAPGTKVLFNCVEGFPLESVAPTPAAALYLELWPPDDTYADVVRWIDRARLLAEGRAVVIAAYAATLKDEVAPGERASAFESVPLLGSVIAAAGAYHHTLAERDRLLVEGYYPAAVPMTPDEAAELRALWRFTARYVHLLSDPEVTATDGDVALELVDTDDAPVPWTPVPMAGAVWAHQRRSAAGHLVLHLIDLRVQSDTDWTAPKVPATTADGWRLSWGGDAELLALSPWTDKGDAMALRRSGGNVALPPFRRWLMAVAR